MLEQYLTEHSLFFYNYILQKYPNTFLKISKNKMQLTQLTLTIVGVISSILLSGAEAEKLHGIDMADVCNVWDCLKSQGINFAIPRAY